MTNSYIGKQAYIGLIEDAYLPDGHVQIEEHVTYYRYVPRHIYEIDLALMGMSEDEQIKVMKAITRITNKRINFKIVDQNTKRKHAEI